MTVRLGPACCALATLVASAAAFGQPRQDEDASSLVERGDALSSTGDHEMASQLYQRAYRLEGQPAVLLKLASEYAVMKKTQWALTHYCEYLAAEPDGSEATTARAQARLLYVELGRGATPTDEDLCKPVGTPGAQPPAQPSPAPATPPAASAPQPPEEPPPAEGGMSTLRIASLGLAGVGLVAFGVGVYYGVEAHKIDDELTNHPVEEPWPVDLRAREARGESYNRRAIALMAGGGAAIAIGAVAFFVLGSSAAPADTVTVAPIVSPDGVGFAAAGRF